MPMLRSSRILRKSSITVAFLVEQLRNLRDGGLELQPISENGAKENQITQPISNRPGLVLAGFTAKFTDQRVQLLGNTECHYLDSLSPEEQEVAFQYLISFPIPCLFLTDNNKIPDNLIANAAQKNIPVFRTPKPTAEFVSLLHDFLADQFAEQQTVHGSLMDVYGIGLLLTGKSGIGKSEVSLDLIERGHRLVADDVVILTRREGNVLIGSGTDLVQHFMEIRGLGLIDIRAMFGVRAIRSHKRVEVVVDLQSWDPEKEYTRLGMVDEHKELLGIALPLVKLPIIPGKNMTVLCEVIAMNHLLRYYGYDPASVFQERLQERIRKKGPNATRGIEYFGHDFE